MELLLQPQHLRSPVHNDRLELCACGRASPVEAGVRHAARVEIGQHAFERRIGGKVGKERRVLPSGDTWMASQQRRVRHPETPTWKYKPLEVLRYLLKGFSSDGRFVCQWAGMRYLAPTAGTKRACLELTQTDSPGRLERRPVCSPDSHSSRI